MNLIERFSKVTDELYSLNESAYDSLIEELINEDDEVDMDLVTEEWLESAEEEVELARYYSTEFFSN